MDATAKVEEANRDDEITNIDKIQSPPDTQTDQSPSRDQVFGTPELLENILLKLVEGPYDDVLGHQAVSDMRTLLLSQRVSKDFKYTIEGSVALKRLLCFEPPLETPSPQSRPRQSTSRRPRSSILPKRSHVGVVNRLIPVGSHRHGTVKIPRQPFTFDVLLDWDSLTEPRHSAQYKQLVFEFVGFRYLPELGTGSWRRMHVLPPDHQIDHVVAELGYDTITKAVPYKGKTLGQYMEGIEELAMAQGPSMLIEGD